ncbi:hemerythrin domain-containing protein [Roseateles sp. YR242]|uniref:hemerythrin domain-containing protein n=1 Tax=Roseateles sp. YR242 TaxID=1855305 RepID=UPI000B85FD98|nr:hemerythrin domain-containing protein [Roseateles sp. YR242]
MSLNDLYTGPGVGFESPMEMLEACHGRVRRTLDLMTRLESHLAEHGITDQARSASSDVLRYFDIAGPAHHEDEERHVLPRLRSSGAPALQVLADRLQADHAAMKEDWQVLRQALIAVRDGNSVEWPSALTRRYVDRYATHLEAEEQIAFPAARQDLTGLDAAAMGQEMAQRRQQKA